MPSAGVVVELEVARVDDAPDGRVDDQTRVVGDGVGHAEIVDGKVFAELDALVRGDLAQVHVALFELELFEFAAEEAERKFRAVHRDFGQEFEHVGQPADVVLVAVGKDPALDFGGVLDHPVDFGHQDVHAQHVGVGEGQTAVDEHNLVFVLQREHVFADFAHPADGDDADIFLAALAALFSLVACHRSPLVPHGEVGARVTPATVMRSPVWARGVAFFLFVKLCEGEPESGYRMMGCKGIKKRGCEASSRESTTRLSEPSSCQSDASADCRGHRGLGRHRGHRDPRRDHARRPHHPNGAGRFCPPTRAGLNRFCPGRQSY